MRPTYASVFAVALLAACVPDQDDTPPPKAQAPEPVACTAPTYAGLVGQPRSAVPSDLPPRTRVIGHGRAVTQDYRPTRLNISLDKDDRVQRVWCG